MRHASAPRAALPLAAALAAVLGAALVLAAGAAMAQGPSYRAPVEMPKAAGADAAAQPQPAQQPQGQQPQGQQPQGQSVQGQQPQGQAGPKFPNKDTAKNRQDYELGTPDSGSTIILGRDAATGESVMIHVPPKKNQPGQEVQQPIEVKPVVPLIWK